MSTLRRPGPPAPRRVVSHRPVGSLNSSLAASSNAPSPPLPPNARTRKDPAKGDGNIKVVVRCRGVSPVEVRNNLTVVADVPSSRGTKVVLTDPSPSFPSSSASSVSSMTSSSTASHPSNANQRSWDFGDRTLEGYAEPKGNVYGPDAKQAMLYDEVAKPILEQVLEGYNCTIFAYGQTGTGKTYTMEGDLTPNGATFHDDAGIIPRTLYYLFDHLSKSECEYTVRCSFVELYNEELRDLNAREDVDSSTLSDLEPTHGSKPTMAPPAGGLRIYDETKNGATGVMIQGLEETFIADAEEGLEVLRKGSERRQIAATNMNERSSRSHSIFTILVHVKDTSAKEGADLLKVGKLNLVDLAGSENVGRSGAVNSRAREAGKINASLLALGRVITMLSETTATSGTSNGTKKQHIPYRESKLTRLLQDSLGGNTKTTIIATISPTSYEETASTLSYALSATSIQNRPEANQKVSKDVLMNQVMAEMGRLKADLKAARGDNGYFVSKESFDDLESERRAFKADRHVFEKTKAALEISTSELQSTRDQLDQNVRALSKTKEQLKRVSDELRETKDDLSATRIQLEDTRVENAQLKVLTDAYEKSREGWKDEANQALDDLDGLRAKLARKTEVERANLAMLADASTSIAARTREIADQTVTLRKAQSDFVWSIDSRLGEFAKRQQLHFEQTKELVALQMDDFAHTSARLAAKMEGTSRNGDEFRAVVDETCALLHSKIGRQAAEAAWEQERLAGDLASELARHVEHTSNLLDRLLEPIRSMHADCVSRLEEDRAVLSRMFGRDTEALHAEIDFLKQVISTLETSYEAELSRLAEEEASIVARVSAELSAATTRRGRTLESTLEEVRRQVDARQGQATEVAEIREERLSKLEQNSAETRESVERALQACLLEERSGRQRIRDSLGNLEQAATSQRVSTSAHFGQQLELLSNAAGFIRSASSRFESDNRAGRIQSRRNLLSLVGQSGETFAAWSLSSEGAHEDVSDLTTRTIRAVDDYANTAARAIVSVNICNDGLASEVQADLQRRVRHDVSTGSTPKPKERPTDRLLPIVDLDSCDRPTVLETLLRVRSADIAASLAADEERQADLEDKIYEGGQMARSPSLESVPPPVANGPRASSVAPQPNRVELRRSKVHVLGERDSNIVPQRRVVGKRILKKPAA
ncbi:hypothetical protein JCM10212_004058 [Sporobolomyces blumeae]